MRSQPHEPETPGSGEARTPEAIRQLETLEAIARRDGRHLSVDRDELLDLLHADTASAGGAR